jgi:diamine N-acetyltransferase
VSDLRLEVVTSGNVEAACAVRVLPHQTAHVEPVAESLALAYTLPSLAWPRLIYDGPVLVGFVMAFLGVEWPGDAPAVTRSGLWRLNVSGRHQGRGYGRFAVEAVCAELRGRGESRCYVTWDSGHGGPEPFYLRLGFRPTGELSDQQVVASLDL